MDSALQVVGQIRLIGREQTVDALQHFLAWNDAFSPASLCILGGPQDSSAIATYWAHDIAEANDLQGRTLAEAISRDAPIIFVDDFIGTGWQAQDIVASWFGIATDHDLHEYHGDPLDPSLQLRLKERPVAFVFAAGTAKGKTDFETFVQSQIPGAIVFVDRSAETLPAAFGRGLFKDPATEAEFKAECARIGAEVLGSRGNGHGAKWNEDRALGYGNDAYLIVFPNNTPTATLTCLWQDGVVDGQPWSALLPRRRKR